MMILFMLMRVYVPVGAKVTGKVQKTVHLTFQERSLMQRTNVYSIGGVMLLMVAAGVLPSAGMVLIVLVLTAVLAMPVRVMLTGDGAAINQVVFRPWTDFTSFTAEPRRIVLHATQGTRPLNLPILAAHQKGDHPSPAPASPGDASPGKSRRQA